MQINWENAVWSLRTSVEKLATRVEALVERIDTLEKIVLAGKSPPPTKRRIRQALDAARGDLALARDRAREQNDEEVAEAIEDLMSKVT